MLGSVLGPCVYISPILSHLVLLKDLPVSFLFKDCLIIECLLHARHMFVETLTSPDDEVSL